jgi:excisionase family DNA binding protein
MKRVRVVPAHNRRRLTVVPTGRPVLPDLLTVPEVAERLRCTPQHVYALFKRDLVSVKVGRNRVVSVEALADFIERNTQRAAS